MYSRLRRFGLVSRPQRVWKKFCNKYDENTCLGHRSHMWLCEYCWKRPETWYKVVSALADASNQRTLAKKLVLTQLFYHLATTTRFTPAKGIIRWLGRNGRECTMSEKRQITGKCEESMSSTRTTNDNIKRVFDMSITMKLYGLKVDFIKNKLNKNTNYARFSISTNIVLLKVKSI